MNQFEYRCQKQLRKFVHQYFAVDDQYKHIPIQNLDENISIIGTGSHEFFLNRQSFLNDLKYSGYNVDNIQFDIINEEYYTSLLNDDICLIFGKIWIKEKEIVHKPIFIEMNTRFSAICKDIDHTIQIVHLHHSVPNHDQKEYEFYPKTMTETVNAALEYSHYLEEIIQLDALTKLYNRIAIENKIDEHLMNTNDCHAFFMLDIDNFKSINDSLGHPTGDTILVEIANILKNLFNQNVLIGRIGGDEFVIYFTQYYQDHIIYKNAQRIIHAVNKLSKKYHIHISCSIGIALSSPQYNSFSKLFSLADKGLYKSKDDGKGRYTKME